MSGRYHDRFSRAISELDTRNAYVCESCSTSVKSLNKRSDSRHEGDDHKKEHAS